MTLDLSLARTIAEEHMIDRCQVIRDPEGTLDDDIDPVTREHVHNPGDETTIYEGPCLAAKTDQQSRTAEGGQTMFRRQWRIRFPISVPRLLAGDIVVMVPSEDPRSNPDLVDQRFKIVEVDDRSFRSSRMAWAEDEKGAKAR